MGECPHPHQQQLFKQQQQQLQNPYHPHHDLNNKYRGLATSATSQNPTHHHINSSAASSSQSHHQIPSQVHGAASVSQWQKELWQKMSFRDDDSGYNDDSDSEGSTGTRHLLHFVLLTLVVHRQVVIVIVNPTRLRHPTNSRTINNEFAAP